MKLIVFIRMKQVDEVSIRTLEDTITAWRLQDKSPIFDETEIKLMVPASAVGDSIDMATRLSKLMGGGNCCSVSYEGPDFDFGTRLIAEALVEHEQEVSKDELPCYVLAEYDYIPQGKHFIQRGVDITVEYQLKENFQMLAASGVYGNVNPWTPEPEEYMAYLDVRVMEHVNVGGIVFIVPGMGSDIEEWDVKIGGPEQEHYHNEHATMIRRIGGRVGIMKGVRAAKVGDEGPKAETPPLYPNGVEL